jgi:hypothetical protein
MTNETCPYRGKMIGIALGGFGCHKLFEAKSLSKKL